MHNVPQKNLNITVRKIKTLLLRFFSRDYADFSQCYRYLYRISKHHLPQYSLHRFIGL